MIHNMYDSINSQKKFRGLYYKKKIRTEKVWIWNFFRYLQKKIRNFDFYSKVSEFFGLFEFKNFTENLIFVAEVKTQKAKKNFT